MGHFRALSKQGKCKIFLVKMSFICMRIKHHFHINNFFALILALWGQWIFPSPQLFYNTEEASGVRSRLAPVNFMFVRHTALFRNFTDIGSAMEKLKKKRKIVFGGNRPPPIFIFYDHTTMIAAEAHFIPYPKCVETLFQEQYKGRKWLWKSLLMRIFRIWVIQWQYFRKIPKNSKTIFETSDS